MRNIFKSTVTATVAFAIGCAPPLAEIAAARSPEAAAATTATAPDRTTARGDASDTDTVAVRKGALTREQYDACQSQDEAAFRRAIEKITQSALDRGLETIDYQGVVADEWRSANVDATLDKRVDEAVTDVRKSSSWGALLQSLADSEQAKKLATAVAERVYRSDDVQKALETVAVGVGRQVGERIEYASEDAATPSAQCLRAFLGTRYGSTIAESVVTDTGTGVGDGSDIGGASVDTSSVLKQSGGGIAGVAILLIRRQLANLARAVGQRIVGSILARLVSVVAGGVGVVLIAKDIWDLRYGVMPIIGQEMKSAETKEKVREEIAKAMRAQISGQIAEIAAATADRIVAIWRNFRKAHATAVGLAERDERFRTFLDGLRPDQLPRLDEVIALTLAKEGEPGIFARLQNGTLRQAVSGLPQSGLQIARETRSIEKGLKWAALAGDDLDRVVEYGLYLSADPADFTSTTLRRVIALNDRLAITRLAEVDAAAREALLELPAADLTRLARALTADELKTLANYLTGLGETPRTTVLKTIAETPAKMQMLASERIRKAVVASSDQTAAVEMMLRNGKLFDPRVAWNDVTLAFEGRVSPLLVAFKHPIALGAVALLALMLLLMIRRLFAAPSGRPPAGRTKDPLSPATSSEASPPPAQNGPTTTSA